MSDRSVYLTGRTYAVKKARDPALIKELQHEVRMYRRLERLQGERVPKMNSFGHVDSGEFYILYDVYKPAPATLTSSQFMYLCITLIEIHRMGILHNDLKMDNILMDDSGRPLLSDFGFASPKHFHPIEYNIETCRLFQNLTYE